jgi:hypothetical protein
MSKPKPSNTIGSPPDAYALETEALVRPAKNLNFWLVFDVGSNGISMPFESRMTRYVSWAARSQNGVRHVRAVAFILCAHVIFSEVLLDLNRQE